MTIAARFVLRRARSRTVSVLLYLFFMKRFDANILAGLVMFVIIVGLAYLSVQRGQVDFFAARDYAVRAEFSTVGGLQEGALVELAGVAVGRVDAIKLVGQRAQITMNLRGDIPLHEDAKAEIKARGLIGERYVALSPGHTGKQIAPGEAIRHTEPPVNIQELLTQMFISADSAEDPKL